MQEAGGTRTGRAAAALTLQVTEGEPGGWLLLLPSWGQCISKYPALCLQGASPTPLPQHPPMLNPLYLFLGCWELQGHACQWAQWPILINACSVGPSLGTPSSQWAIQHAGLPGIASDGRFPARPRHLAYGNREGPGSGSPHHRTCWASGGSACCIRVFPRRSRSSRPLFVGGGACAGGRPSVLEAWAGGAPDGSVPSDDCGQTRWV